MAFKFLKWWRTSVSPSRSLRWKDYRPEPLKWGRSSGLPIPSRELGLSARAFKFLKWWRTPVSPSRSLRWKDYRPEPQSQSNNHVFRPLRMVAIRFFFIPTSISCFLLAVLFDCFKEFHQHVSTFNSLLKCHLDRYKIQLVIFRHNLI